MPKVSETYKEKRRAHLVSTAEQVFLRKGYSRTSVQDIITAADVSHGSFYLYFASKAEIFEAVLERQDRDALRQLQQIRESPLPIGPTLLEIADLGPVEAESRQRVAMVVEFNLEHRDDPQLQEQLLARRRRIETAFVAVLQEGVDRGEIHPRMALRTIVRFFIEALDGGSIHRAVTGQVDEDFAMGLQAFLRHSLGMGSDNTSSF